MRFVPQRRAILPHPSFKKWSELQKCFSLQRRAIFPHPNFRKWSEHGVFSAFGLANVLLATKWSEHGVFCTFWLGNVLRAKAACNFLTSQHPKVVRECVLCILNCKCASRHSGVPFFHMPTSKKWSGKGVFCTFWLENALRATAACNFSFVLWPHGSAPAALASLLLDPPGPQIIGKTQQFVWHFAHLYPLSTDFSRTYQFSFFWLYFSALLFNCPYCLPGENDLTIIIWTIVCAIRIVFLPSNRCILTKAPTCERKPFPPMSNSDAHKQ